MPRTKPVTTFTARVKPSTTYERPRENMLSPISFDSTITFDSSNYTWDMISEWSGVLSSVYTTPRYAMYLRDITQQNVLDLSWEQVLWISGRRENKIVTIYT